MFALIVPGKPDQLINTPSAKQIRDTKLNTNDIFHTNFQSFDNFLKQYSATTKLVPLQNVPNTLKYKLQILPHLAKVISEVYHQHTNLDQFVDNIIYYKT